MNIENYIESQYRELLSCSQINAEYSDLYKSFRNQKLREILMTLHHDLVGLFKTMNERLPTGEHEAHFWAEPSRDLIKRIEIIFSLVSSLKETPLAFQIDPYYLDLLTRCRDFLSSSGGSSLPPNMAKVELYYRLPIFLPLSSITISHKQQDFTFDLKLIGSGSYANVYKYKDTFYNRPFILKRAKKELTDKEVARFKREFDVMNNLSSPYILEVYCYNPDKNEYIMEYMDYTLDGYIAAHNSTLTIIQRKGIAQQILRAFDYLHSKGHLHRDISPKNILIKEYDDTLVVKLSDFGLVKILDSTLTTVNTEFKGYFNDPALVVEGFNTYGIVHETYALTRVIYFVMTGKTNTEKIANQNLRAFVERGLNPDKTKRFQNIRDMISAFKTI
ncbi:TPA: protein kinase family protein [Clostridioides difficile]|jgi:tRNA A-37 threonylcarbamoyl transferase component Bud32|uniref:protein kinase family protein n=1 Tax=Clostridioides difficile TaxID=1496 RepID=UPI001A347DFF|nr:protein kinase family protein [Clostridioides difficile]EGT4978017.1 protein kinase family protein [Clostridioides difficile]EGT5496480.1 protein kinase family protein [Clostridioides difficile]EJX2697371.1 protein kinase family protein [Clostridioides difficile]EKS7081863.1 protein kinase family protein [Clostridioides difficile]